MFHGAGGIAQAFENAAGWADRFGVNPGMVNCGQVQLEA